MEHLPAFLNNRVHIPFIVFWQPCQMQNIKQAAGANLPPASSLTSGLNYAMVEMNKT